MSIIPVTPDFADACERHWTDAQVLHSNNPPRLANADHLYGLAAECGLKAVMVALGMVVDPVTGRPSVAKHVDRLWAEFVTFASGHSGALYASMLPGSNPFHDWLLDQRYTHQSHYAEPTPTEHKDGAEEVRKILLQARIDGKVR